MLAAGVVPAQNTEQRQPTFRSGVELIEIDINVVDGDGRPLTDLTASDFTVSVEGEPRRVVQAQFLSLGRSGPDDTTAAPQGVAFHSTNATGTRGRLIVLVVDQGNSC